METDLSQLPGPVPGLLRREAARWWWVPLVTGVVWLLLSWLVLRLNATSLATVGVLVGVVFLYAAVSEGGLSVIMSGGWRVLHVALGVLFVLGAIWAFVRPVNTLFALASVLGLLLVLQGALAIIQGVAIRDVDPSWWVQMFLGVLTVLLGLWVSTSDRVWNLSARVVFVLLFVGFMAIFRGIWDIVLAFQLRRLSNDGTGGQQAVWHNDGRAPAIPAQQPHASAGTAGPGRSVAPGSRG
jgi:uncharacterized membrane protein HdeD (DUF308 family)